MEDLKKVERAEEALAGLGFFDFRVRLYGEAARIQVTEQQMALLLLEREKVLEALKPLFSEVLLDLTARQVSR